MKDKATKRPWIVSRPVSVTRDYDEEGHYIRSTAIDGWPVCANTGENDLDRAEQLANAQLIVKAVNCHDELVEALKMILEYDEKTLIRRPYTNEKYKPLTNLLREKSKQALKKASE